MKPAQMVPRCRASIGRAVGLDRQRLVDAQRRVRVWKYRMLSTGPAPPPSARIFQPVLVLGPGRIAIGEDVEFGWPTSQNFHTGYCHFEASTDAAVIEIGDGARINNDVFVKSEGPGIRIGPRALLGSSVCIYDSDFHDLHPARRIGGHARMEPVTLEENVFIGDRAIILKGVTIGRDAVVGAGSVVTRSIPAGAIAAGNPARVVGDVWAARDGALAQDRGAGRR